jgi:hypothetical protein
MKRWWIKALLLVGALAIPVALAIGAVIVFVLPEQLGTVWIDGQVLDLGHLHAGHWLLASAGVLIAMLVVLVVVPLVVLVATLVPLLGAGLVIALALALAAVVLSPLILLVWWLWKQASKPATMPA